ncbi:hypothetical protein V6N13_084980 [Hibiscus sabdariffa]|uniref:Uncharacterized protein n=1 Tax=Hibiscus sabdariffa TaxID=183260 RepID=A0ABR2D1U2_9ROSI
MKVGESSSESTSEKLVFQTPEDSVQMEDSVHEDALMAMCFGKQIYDENINGKRIGSISLGENELASEAFEETNQSSSNIGEKVVSVLLDEVEVTAGKTGPKWADVVGGAGRASGLQPEQDSCRDRKENAIEMVENEGDLLWTTKVDRANGAKYDANPLSRG